MCPLPLQGKTGLMTRFGPHDPAEVAAKGAGAGTPNFHGVASCVDYLTGCDRRAALKARPPPSTLGRADRIRSRSPSGPRVAEAWGCPGLDSATAARARGSQTWPEARAPPRFQRNNRYMAMWGGLAALYSRDATSNPQGDWAVTSLATCASLTQLTLQKGEPPASAVGCHATGMTAHRRVFEVAGGRWVYGQAPESADADALVATLATLDVDGAIAHFAERFGTLAVPVHTVREIAALCSDGASKTANFKKKDSGMGWEVETWEPTWFCLDGQPLSCAGAPTFSGADAPAILSALGYSQGDILGLKQSRAVVPTNWHKWADESKATPLKLFYSDELIQDGLE